MSGHSFRKVEKVNYSTQENYERGLETKQPTTKKKLNVHQLKASLQAATKRKERKKNDDYREYTYINMSEKIINKLNS